MQIKVVSMRNSLNPELGWTDIRVDRLSVLGNPFELKDESQRDAVIAAYRKWLWENIKVMENGFDTQNPVPVNIYNLAIAKNFKNPTPMQVTNELTKIKKMLEHGEKVRLVCWCKPKSCHADIILSCLTKYW